MSSISCDSVHFQRIISGIAIEAKKQLPFQFQKRKKRIIVIAGPTCCGKSALGLELAKMINGEIISADSMQVYRGMDIGTAKPTMEERLLVPHHLIDIRDVNEVFNAVDFYFEARQSCQKALERGSTPIVVGGSGFYLHTLLYGPPSGPPSLPEVRQMLEREMEKLGAAVLYDRLLAQDPHYARTITKNDKQKIIRALEIMTLTHKKVSELSWKGRRELATYDFRCWFIHRQKDVLYRRIEQRCHQMLEAGFLEEVKKLKDLGIEQNSSAKQAIGYRQALEYLNNLQSEAEYEKFVKEFMQSTKHYVKRQMTWFKKEPLFRWIDIDMHDPEVVLDLIRKDYETL